MHFENRTALFSLMLFFVLFDVTCPLSFPRPLPSFLPSTVPRFCLFNASLHLFHGLAPPSHPSLISPFSPLIVLPLTPLLYKLFIYLLPQFLLSLPPIQVSFFILLTFPSSSSHSLFPCLPSFSKCCLSFFTNSCSSLHPPR